MLAWLASLPTTARYPTWLVSHARADGAPLLDRMRTEWATPDHNIHLMVRGSEADAYRALCPFATVHTLPYPDDEDCVGAARWAAVERAAELGHRRILMLDDDILQVRFMFKRHITKGKNQGAECSGTHTKEDAAVLPYIEEHVLAGFCTVAEEVLETNPLAMMGGMLKRHMSFSASNHQTKYVVNGGVTPKQVQVWDVQRMLDRGVRLDTDLFGRHGDDIGLVADVLANGGQCWAEPSFVYDVWSEDVNVERSVVRNAGNLRALHALEYFGLQHYPVKNYLRERRSKEDGSFEWAEVDWRKYHKQHGTEPYRVFWDD